MYLVHPTISTLPIGITKTALQNFAGTRFGQRLTPDHHRSGHLESADTLPAYGHDLIDRDGGARFGDHLGMVHLSEALVGNPEHRDFEHGGMAKDGVLNFSRVDVFAPEMIMSLARSTTNR